MTRCSLCPGDHNCVPADGPFPCRTLFIGEAPGKDEDRRGFPFVGKTGQEVNDHYLPLAGLRRSQALFTNSIHCLPSTPGGKLDSKNEKHRDLLDSCTTHHLYNEIQEANPKVIIPMGAFACLAIDPDIDLELKHGYPIRTSWGWTFPMYHPAGGIHEPKKMLLIRNDWIRLGHYLKGKLNIPVDEYPNPDYRVADAAQVRRDLEGMQDYPIACDTENMKGKEPFCLTYSVEEGTGRLIRAGDQAALDEFQRHITGWKSEILWHNWLYDIQITTAMGLVFPRKRIVDTMVRVFHLGNLPQGLKALAWRELGMKMQDFDDVVTPHSAPIVLAYYRLANLRKWPKPEEDLVRDKEGKLKLYKPQGFNTLLKRFFTDLSKNPQKDLFEMWTKNWADKHEMVEAMQGPWPGKCISHAPFEDVLWYAARDSDALLRLWNKRLKRMIPRMRKGPQETWGEWVA